MASINTQSSSPALNSVIQAALRDCYDPTLPCNIVDLGLVQSITLTPDPQAPGANIPGVPQKFRAIISLIPATHDEAAVSQLSAQIANRLSAFEQIIHTTVLLLDTPIWTPALITSAGRRILGLDGNPHLVQIGGNKIGGSR